MKKALCYIAAVVLAVLYCAFIVFRVLQQPMNSDSATMLLYAEDILSGNIFLSGWHLTGLTFLTTDLPFYIIGVAVFGVGLNAFRVSVILMWLYMAFSALLVALYKSRNKWFSLLIMAAVGLFPTTYALSNAFVHTAVFGHIFLAVLFLKIYNEKGSYATLVALGLITALAVCGDSISILMITIPVVLMFALRCIDKKTVITVAIGTASGILAEKLFLFIGGANLNTLQQQSFIEIHRLWYNIRTYTEYFLRLINAYFFDKNLFSVKTVFFAAKIIIAGFSFFLIYKNLKSATKKENHFIATVMLGLGFVLMTVVLFISTINTNITAGRYIGFVPPMLGIVISEYAGTIQFGKKTRVAISAFCILIAMTGIIPSGSSFSPYNTYSELADFLRSETLSLGYGSFWDASVINGYSENTVRVRPVLWEDNQIRPRVWFCKNEWYETDVDFVLVRNSGSLEDEDNYKYNGIYHMRLNADAMYGITYDNTVSYFGEPKKVLTFKNYSVLIYK